MSWRFAAPLAALGLVLSLFMVIEGIAHHSSFRDGDGHYYGGDFINYWAAPQIARQDTEALATLPAYNNALQSLHGAALPPHNWSYPPPMLLLVKPFSLFPLRTGFLLWTVSGLLLFAWAACAGAAKNSRLPVLLLTLCAPATMLNIVYGQNGFFTAALTLGALLLLEHRPRIAGGLLGILSAKPQLAVAWPFLLLARRHWRTLFAAILTGILLVGLSLAVYGPEIWHHFFIDTLAVQSGLLTPQPRLSHYELMIASLPLALRELGMPAQWAFRLYALVAFAAAAALALVLRAKNLPRPLLALLLTSGTLVISPYSFNYDMTALSAALIWCLGEPATPLWQRLIYAVGYLLPVLVYFGWFLLGVPVAAFFLPVLFLVALQRAKPFAFGGRVRYQAAHD